jgi:hypothetical protein
MTQTRRRAEDSQALAFGTGALLLLISLSGCASQGGKKVTQEVAPLYSAASPEFRQATGSLLGGTLFPAIASPRW